MQSMSDDVAQKSNDAPRRGCTRRRWGCCSVKKAGRAVIYVSDFLPPSSKTPWTPKLQHDEQLLDAKDLRAVSASRRAGRTRGTALLSGVLTAIPSRVRLRGCRGASHVGSRLKGKQKDPDAPFNHRARISKMKRSILDERKAAFLSLTPHAHRSDHDELSLPHFPPVSAPDAVVCGDVSCASAVDAQIDSMDELLHLMRSLVIRMELRYGKLHNSMRRKDYTRAGRHISAIRRLKRFLTLTALRWRVAAAGEASGTPRFEQVDTQQQHTPRMPMKLHACAAMKSKCHDDNLEEEPNFVNFYPPLAHMGVGRHPLATCIDRRSSRYPRRLNADAVTRLRDAPVEEVQKKTLKQRENNYVAAYCTNIVTDELDDLVFTILQQQYHLQCRMKKDKPLQFKARRFYSTGLRETLKGLRAASTRIPVVLLAADIEVTESTHVNGGYSEKESTEGNKLQEHNARRRTVQELGVQGTLEEIRSHCASRNIPLITCMSRRRMAYALFMKGCSVSSVLLYSAEGVHEEVKAFRRYTQRLCEEYVRVAAENGLTPPVP